LLTVVTPPPPVFAFHHEPFDDFVVEKRNVHLERPLPGGFATKIQKFAIL
jgi:hypothetical protein